MCVCIGQQVCVIHNNSCDSIQPVCVFIITSLRVCFTLYTASNCSVCRLVNCNRIDLMLNPGGEEERRTPWTYAARHQEAMRTAHREARQKLQQSQRRQKRDYDMRLEERKYSVDGAVYRFNRSIVLGQSKKFTAHLVRSLDCDTCDFISIVSYC